MSLLGPLVVAARPLARVIGRAAAAQARELAMMAALAAMAPLGRAGNGVAARVDRLLAETGTDKVHLIGHSLGGIVIAQAFADGRLDGQVDTVVTIATPFGGSPWANLCPLGATVRALRHGSPLLCRLAEAPVPDGVRWLAITGARDVIVPGRRSVPGHAEVRSVTVDDVGHLGMLLSPLVVAHIVEALPADERAVA